MTHDPELSRWQLLVLGAPRLVALADASETALGPGKSLALLAYLAVRRQARRDELISRLWGEMPEEQARNAFRQALHRIRRTIGTDVLSGDRDVLALTSGADGVLIDRDEFLQAVETERWADAFAAYRGDFLEGFELGEPAFDRWAGVERMQLRARFQTALRRHAERTLESGDAAAATLSAARLVASAPYEHEAALFQANVLLAAGKSADALATLRQFVARLQSELELPPPAEVIQLLSRLERSVARGEASARPLSSEPRNPPFIGRGPQLARLISGVTRAREEQGSAFVLEAEAGLGRTRMLDELAKRTRDLGGVHVLRGRERTAANVVPYAGIAEALRPLANAAGVAGASRHLLAEAARILPELRDSFDLPIPTPIEDEAGRFRFFEGVAAIVDAAAYEQPVCILLDDAHHASGPTLDLLGYLVGRLQMSPVMFVLSMRSDRTQSTERIRALISAGTGSAEALVTLPALTPEETRTLVEACFPESARDSIDVERIIRQSRGRPLLAIELAKKAASGETLSEVPALLRDILWARLQAAAPSQRRVFFAAALLERRSSVRLLAAAAHLPESAALEAALRLTEAGLLHDEESGFVVAHESTISFVVDASGIAGRAMLAGWAADALASETPGADAELANLYAMAGRSAMAFAHARAAAFDAAAVGALSEARHHLGVALTFAPDEKARSQIEALLSAYGFGSLRLAGTVDAETSAMPIDELRGGEQAATEQKATQPSKPTDDGAARPPRTSRGARARRAAREWYMAIALSVIIVLLGILARRQFAAPSPAAPGDSLLVAKHDRATGENSMFAIAVDRNGPQGSLVARGQLPTVSWVANLTAPWSDALVSPNQQRVAVARVTAQGKELFVISADRRDTLRITTGDRDNIPLGWSPDSRALLISRSRMLADGSYDSDLYMTRVGGPQSLIPLDTSPARSIADARWSPTGTDVAWIARVGSTRQRDVFVGRADGTDVVNISSSPADDYGITWSPDGSLLAFTSTRDGGPRLYTYDFENHKLWNVSDRDGEDRATFSPDGRHLAFESARNGAAAVYVRPALGGAARRVTPDGGEYSFAGWTKPTDGWIERVRIVGATTLAVGDTTTASVLAVAANGSPVSGMRPVWVVQQNDQTIETESVGATMRIAARHEGTARIIASLAGWRADTVTLVVAPANNALRDDFSGALSPARWITLGDPQPFAAPNAQSASGYALFPNGDLEWDSGVLSRSVFSLAPGLIARARLLAPFGGRPSAAAVAVGLAPVGNYDVRAPQVRPTISVSWDGQSGALHYSVGRDTYSDAQAVRSDSLAHDVEFRIAADSTVIFSVDGRQRWQSSLRYSADLTQPRVQLWAGGHATGRSVAIASVSVEPARR